MQTLDELLTMTDPLTILLSGFGAVVAFGIVVKVGRGRRMPSVTEFWLRRECLRFSC